MSQTTEKAFETYVTQMLSAKGWQQGSVSEPVNGSIMIEAAKRR